MIAEDLLLHATKIFYVWFEEAVVAKEDADSHLYFYNDEFEYPIRRMLCGRDASLYEFVNQMRKQQERASYVNYICDNNGFTLADLFHTVKSTMKKRRRKTRTEAAGITAVIAARKGRRTGNTLKTSANGWQRTP